MTARTPAPGATGVAVSATAHRDLQRGGASRPLSPSSGRGPGQRSCPATTSYDAASRTVTLDPNANLATNTTYTATVSGARDTAGNQMDLGQLDLHHHRATASAVPCTIWPTTTTPAATDPDSQLGRARREVPRQRQPASSPASATTSPARPPAPTWAACGPRTGTRLGNVTFTNETASGWQQATFASPIAGHGRHDLRRVVLHAEPLRRQRRLLRQRGDDPRPAHGACRTARTAATASTATRPRRAPSPTAATTPRTTGWTSSSPRAPRTTCRPR